MAEVFGVVVSALTVAELASKFGSSILKLKKLWNEVQDVPNDISQRMKQLEILKPILEEMEIELCRGQRRVYHNGAAKLSLEYCQQATSELEEIVDDLQKRIRTSKASRMNLVKLKVTFKKDLMQSYHERIQFAIQLLTLSQQSYIIALVKPPPLNSTAPCGQSASTQIKLEGSDANHATINSKATSLAWRKASFFGGFVYKTISRNEDPDSRVSQARFYLPWWLSERVWDLQAYRAGQGWKVSIVPWNIRPESAPIFRNITHGSWSDALDLLKNNTATLYDRGPDGATLLHVAASCGNVVAIKNLIGMGLGPQETNNQGHTFVQDLRLRGRNSEDVKSLIKLLASTGCLDLHVPLIFRSDGKGILGHSIFDLMWSFPGVLQIMSAEAHVDAYKLAPEIRFASLQWHLADPEIVLEEIYRDRDMEPVAFRSVFMGPTESSFTAFAEAYFANSQGPDRFWIKSCRSVEQTDQFRYWRKLARWAFCGLSLEDLLQLGCVNGDYGLTPLFAGLVALDCQLVPTTLSSRAKLRLMSKVMASWLEDLQSTSIDLSEYGRCEMDLYHDNEWPRSRQWLRSPNEAECFPRDHRTTRPSIPRLVNFTTGPKPEDWKLFWDFNADVFAGEFWDAVENPPMPVPGEYLEDDYDCECR